MIKYGRIYLTDKVTRVPKIIQAEVKARADQYLVVLHYDTKHVM